MEDRQQSLFDLMANGNSAGGEAADPFAELALFAQECLQCASCGLRSGCRQVVFGEGNHRARLMLVGEGPGADEDKAGRPFVGAAGQLLDRILEAVCLGRDEVYITNIVKCRPPSNRLPAPGEVEQCLPHLKRQIQLIKPAIIVCLGALATRTLVDRSASITAARGRWKQFEGRWYMPTFHPAALLRDPGKKRPVWEDFKEVEKRYREITDGGGPG